MSSESQTFKIGDIVIDPRNYSKIHIVRRVHNTLLEFYNIVPFSGTILNGSAYFSDYTYPYIKVGEIPEKYLPGCLTDSGMMDTKNELPFEIESLITSENFGCKTNAVKLIVRNLITHIKASKK